jgi:hypothetical protein
MKRDKNLLAKRIKKIGLFAEIKRHNGASYKRTVLELSEALTIGVHTVVNDLSKYNKNRCNYADPTLSENSGGSA